VPVFGFGGVPKLPTYKKAYSDNAFPLNGNIKEPFCKVNLLN